jgi:hypothetical protein
VTAYRQPLAQALEAGHKECAQHVRPLTFPRRAPAGRLRLARIALVGRRTCRSCGARRLLGRRSPGSSLDLVRELDEGRTVVPGAGDFRWSDETEWRPFERPIIGVGPVLGSLDRHVPWVRALDELRRWLLDRPWSGRRSQRLTFLGRLGRGLVGHWGDSGPIVVPVLDVPLGRALGSRSCGQALDEVVVVVRLRRKPSRDRPRRRHAALVLAGAPPP